MKYKEIYLFILILSCLFLSNYVSGQILLNKIQDTTTYKSKLSQMKQDLSLNDNQVKALKKMQEINAMLTHNILLDTAMSYDQKIQQINLLASNTQAKLKIILTDVQLVRYKEIVAVSPIHLKVQNRRISQFNNSQQKLHSPIGGSFKAHASAGLKTANQ